MPNPAEGLECLQMVGMFPQDNGPAQTDAIYFDKKGLFIVDTQNGLQINGTGGLLLATSATSSLKSGQSAGSPYWSFLVGGVEQIRLQGGGPGAGGGSTGIQLQSQINAGSAGSDGQTHLEL